MTRGLEHGLAAAQGLRSAPGIGAAQSEVIRVALGTSAEAVLPVLRALGSALLLLVLSVVVWYRRTRVLRLP